MAFANAFAGALTGGVAYAVNSPLTSTEASLYNQQSPPGFDPLVPTYHQTIAAVVEFSLNNGTGSNTSYVVLQGDFGDGVWIDLAWCVWTGQSGTATFLLCAGAFVGNSVQQTRVAGTAPGSNGSIQCPLPGRLRFVGKATLGGGSSSSSGNPSPTPVVSVTIRYRMLPVA